MQTVLQVAGPVFPVLILVVLIVFLLLLRRRKRLKKPLDAVNEKVATPSKIHLKKDPAPDWLKGVETKKVLTRLVKSGFKPGRAYTVTEMPDVLLLSLFHRKTGVVCVLYKHVQAGEWVDLVVQYESGEELTISNAPHGGELDQRPGAIKVFLPNAPLSELSAAYNKHALKKPKVKIDVDNFRDVFEKAYAADMQWRAERGGVTKEEIHRVAEGMSRVFQPDVITETHRYIKEEELYQRHYDCIEEFRNTAYISAEEWTSYEDKGDFIIVTEAVDADVYLEYLGDNLNLTEEWVEKFKKTARNANAVEKLFHKVNKSMPRHLRARKIGSVEKPVIADIYIAPYEKEI